MSLIAKEDALAHEERELWATARDVLRRYGDGFSDFIDARVSELARQGDDVGVWHWLRVVGCIDQLRPPGSEVALH